MEAQIENMDVDEIIDIDDNLEKRLLALGSPNPSHITMMPTITLTEMPTITLTNGKSKIEILNDQIKMYDKKINDEKTKIIENDSLISELKIENVLIHTKITENENLKKLAIEKLNTCIKVINFEKKKELLQEKVKNTQVITDTKNIHIDGVCDMVYDNGRKCNKKVTPGQKYCKYVFIF
jgi:hypothetical protein